MYRLYREIQDSTTEPVVERVMEVTTQELEGLVRWLVENRETNLAQLEQGLLERGRQLLVGLLGTSLFSAWLFEY